MDLVGTCSRHSSSERIHIFISKDYGDLYGILLHPLFTVTSSIRISGHHHRFNLRIHLSPRSAMRRINLSTISTTQATSSPLSSNTPLQLGH